MKTLFLLGMMVVGLSGCVKRIPNPTDPNWQYVSTHDCHPTEHIDAYVSVNNGVEHPRSGFTAYKCAGITLDVFVTDPAVSKGAKP